MLQPLLLVSFLLIDSLSNSRQISLVFLRYSPRFFIDFLEILSANAFPDKVSNVLNFSFFVFFVSFNIFGSFTRNGVLDAVLFVNSGDISQKRVF
jgi:hypothetical protein